jgi:hypothetical protein
MNYRKIRLETKLCHPEAHLLREGSPAMYQSKLAVSVAPPRETRHYGPKSLASAFQAEAFREVLRATEALRMTGLKSVGILLSANSSEERTNANHF